MSPAFIVVREHINAVGKQTNKITSSCNKCMKMRLRLLSWKQAGLVSRLDVGQKEREGVLCCLVS